MMSIFIKKFFLKCVALMFCFFQCRALLTHQQASFIANHLVCEDQRQILDEIFSHLSPSLMKLLAGESITLTKEEVVSLFEKSGFKVYTVHHRSLNQPDSDGRPARVVLRHKSQFSDYFLKIGFDTVKKFKNLSRIPYSDFINRTIEALKLTRIGTLEKKIYHRIGRPDDLVDFNYLVISPRIRGKGLAVEKISTLDKKNKKKRKKIFPDAEIECEYELLKKAVEYSDDYYRNFKIADDGLFYIIDTEAGRKVLPQLIMETFGISH